MLTTIIQIGAGWLGVALLVGVAAGAVLSDHWHPDGGIEARQKKLEETT